MKKDLFANNPTLSELRDELTRQISLTHESAKIEITLNKKYSHRAIKQVLTFLGYEPCSKKPEKKFYIKKK